MGVRDVWFLGVVLGGAGSSAPGSGCRPYGEGRTGQRRANADQGRIARLVGLASVVPLVIAALMILPALVDYLAIPTHRYSVELSALGFLCVYGVARLIAARPGSGPAPSVARHGVALLEFLADRTMRVGLAVVATMCLGILATWVPHYLTWPLWRDADAFATLAMQWDAGIRPYRDVVAYNFPGHVYLFWVLGKTVGWGRPVAFYAVDVALVALLGFALVAWSRRRLGGSLPGLVAYLSFLAFYAGQFWQNVAQRDWHAALGVALALMVLEAVPGRTGRVVSAWAVALALATRPHVVLFLPALASAVVESVRRGATTSARPARALGAWGLTLVVFVTLAFSPVILQGLADDLARNLRLRVRGGPYDDASLLGALTTFVGQFGDWRASVALGALLWLAVRSTTPEGRGLARTWSLALVGALLYKPVHPARLQYLDHVLALFGSIALAPWVAGLAAPRPARPARVLLLALLIYEIMPAAPRYCTVSESLGALPALAWGVEPVLPPAGVEGDFITGLRDPLPWQNYRALLRHLRRTTGPATPVANAIDRRPFEAVNGPTGRPSPFRAESGLCLMLSAAIDLDTPFAEALARAEGAVVVWTPGSPAADPRLPVGRIAEAIRRHYRFEDRFGDVEVWRRQ